MRLIQYNKYSFCSEKCHGDRIIHNDTHKNISLMKDYTLTMVNDQSKDTTKDE